MITSNRINNLHPYTPGEQPKDRIYIKLNANENPYPPCKQVINDIKSFVNKNPQKITLYPDPDSEQLKQAIADMLNKTGGVLCRTQINHKNVSPAIQDTIPFTVTKDMIYAGNGSDEVLSFLFYAFFDSSKKFVMPQFTYSFYPVYAGFYDIPTECVPLNADWSLNTNQMLESSKKNDAGIIFANPNAPTGLALTRNQVRDMLLKSNKDSIFIVDEAYVDFGGESCIPLLQEFKNLVIVRTFSKSLCAAGMRLGYAVSNPELINIITMVKNSVNHFPIDSINKVAGISACKNAWYYADCAKKVCQERDAFYDFLKEHGFYVIKSSTNFLFAKKDGIKGQDLYKKIKEQGFLIRHFNTSGIEDFVRITIGTKQQMQKLKNAFLKVC